jgi:hypothetical protein
MALANPQPRGICEVRTHKSLAAHHGQGEADMRSQIPPLAIVIACFALTRLASAQPNWTNFQPVEGQTIVYVSEDGSDSGGSQGEVYTWTEDPQNTYDIDWEDPFNPPDAVLAFRTMAAAYNQLTAGEPGWMLLRRGDDFTDETAAQVTLKSGPSSGPGWMLIGAYREYESEETGRPAMKRLFYFSSTASLHRIAIVGIQVVGDVTSGNDGVIFIVPANGSHFRIEDVYIPAGRATGITIHSNQDGTGDINDVVIRGCVVFGRRPGPDSKAQGIYVGSTDDLIIEDCVLWNNGWTPESCPWSGHCPDESPGNIFGHNLYVQCNCRNGLVRRNISADASSHGCQHRPDGTNENNLYLRNPIALGVGSGDCSWATEASDPIARRNVIIDGSDTSPTIHRGFGISVGNTDGALIEDNIIAHQQNGNLAQGLEVRYNCINTLFQNNIVYNWASQGGGGFAAQIDCDVPTEQQGANWVCLTPYDRDDVRFENNDFFQPNDGYLVWHGPEEAGNPIVHPFLGNRYYSTYNNPVWIEMFTSPAQCCGSQYLVSFASWVSFIDEQDEDWVSDPAAEYYEPERDIESYMTLVYERNDWGTYVPIIDPISDFMNEAIQQSKTNWRGDFAAATVNGYIREGFYGPDPCPTDLDENGWTDIFDLLILLGDWGACPSSGPCPADFNTDGFVDVFDLLTMLNAWGPCFAQGSAGLSPEEQDCFNKYDLGTSDLEECLRHVQEFGTFYEED